MITIKTSEGQKQNLDSQSEVWWRQLLFLGIIGLGLFLLVAPNVWRHSSADEPKPSAPRPVRENARPSSETQRMELLSPSGSQLMQGHDQRETELTEDWATEGRTSASIQPLEPVRHSQLLDVLIKRLKGASAITAEDTKEIKRLLQELQKQGTTALPAIRDFLHSKEDVDFDNISGSELLDHHTLRQALFDTLRQIGGNEAVAVSLEQLRETQAPAEIALLARNLEEGAPGVYRAEALWAVNNALQLWSGPQEQVEVRPLFELLRDLGGAEAVAALEQYPANADAMQYLRNTDTNVSPTWRMYSLLALTGLPEGEGISKLSALAGDPEVPVAHKAELPFQMLAQSSMDYAEAGQALVDLARAGQIPDRAWSAIAEALEGKYLQFPSQLSGGALPAKDEAEVSGVEAPFLRGYYDEAHRLKYEQRLVSEDWSTKQFKQQVALIDKLLATTPSFAGVQALQQARTALLRKD